MVKATGTRCGSEESKATYFLNAAQTLSGIISVGGSSSERFSGRIIYDELESCFSHYLNNTIIASCYVDFVDERFYNIKIKIYKEKVMI